VALDWAELGFDETPRRLGDSSLLRVLHLEQVDQPALRRNQQAGRLLAWVQIQHDAAHDPPRIVVMDAPPNAGLAADFQRQIEHAVLEILNPLDVRQRTTIRNRNSHHPSFDWTCDVDGTIMPGR